MSKIYLKLPPEIVSLPLSLFESYIKTADLSILL